jgi:hypothetical protein
VKKIIIIVAVFWLLFMNGLTKVREWTSTTNLAPVVTTVQTGAQRVVSPAIPTARVDYPSAARVAPQPATAPDYHAAPVQQPTAAPTQAAPTDQPRVEIAQFGSKVEDPTPADAVAVSADGRSYQASDAPPPAGMAPTALPLDPAALPPSAYEPARGQCLHGQVWVGGKGCRNPAPQAVGSVGSKVEIGQ